MTALILASVAIVIAAFGLAVVEGYLRGREMARSVEGAGSTWNSPFHVERESKRGVST